MKLFARQESTVETGTPSAAARLEVPPNSAMISGTVMSENSVTENRKATQEAFPLCGVYRPLPYGQTISMITTGEILALLQEKIAAGEINKTQIAKVAGIGNNRVSELFGSGKGRGLKHDEAVRLAEGFGLELPQAPRVPPLPAPIARLLVIFVAEELGYPVLEHPERVEELAEVARAFAEYVADPQVRGSQDAAEHFFRSMRSLRSVRQEEDSRGTHRQNTH